MSEQPGYRTALQLLCDRLYNHYLRERQAYLMQVDNIERLMNELRPGSISPRTAELRKDRKMPEPKPPVKGDTVRWER